MLDRLARVGIRVAVFAAVELLGTFAVNRGKLDASRAVLTIAIFVVFNIAFELWSVVRAKS